MCETSSNQVIVFDHTSFERGIFLFLHALHETLDAFNTVLQDFGLSQQLEQYYPKNILHNHFQNLPYTLGNKHNIFLNHDFVTPSADFIMTSNDFVQTPEDFITTSLLLMTPIFKLFDTPSDAITISN